MIVLKTSVDIRQEINRIKNGPISGTAIETFLKLDAICSLEAAYQTAILREELEKQFPAMVGD